MIGRLATTRSGARIARSMSPQAPIDDKCNREYCIEHFTFLILHSAFPFLLRALCVLCGKFPALTTTVRLIIDSPLPGPWNMAADEALLDDAVANGTAALRFYQWSEPTLSLGYFQSYAERDLHAASRDCAVVRRQSGGGAILHDRELTYSLTLPPGHRLVHNAPQLYDNVHASFIEVLAASLPAIDRRPSTRLRMRGDEPANDGPESFLCFQRRSPGDVVFERIESSTATDPSTSASDSSVPWKILGSAQRRHRGAILQHGSLLIERTPAAPELPGLTDLSGISVKPAQLIPTLCERLACGLQLRLNAYQLSAELKLKAADLANTKYASPIWTKRR